MTDKALRWLEAHATEHDRANVARFGITAEKAFGVSMKNIQTLAKELGRSHELAEALWATEWYEARMLCSFVDEPAKVTAAQMEAWCKDFDNWGICDTVCFHLFDRTPHAWKKVPAWCRRKPEFQKRAGFALLACLAGHDKKTGDAPFLEGLALIEAGAADDRNFVKKGVNWALRRIGGRSPVLYRESVLLARRLGESDNAGARWVGKDALREFQRPGHVAKFGAV